MKNRPSGAKKFHRCVADRRAVIIKKRQAIWVLCIACLFLLTACGGVSLTGQNVEELLRAPQLSSTQNAVQTALNQYLGETLQLKYPRGGDEMAPLLFEDLDGDGAQEAVVLYATEAGAKTVNVAVLEQTGEDWNVAYDLPGLGAEVAQVEVVTLLQEGKQLVIGYANANMTEKYLVAYGYVNGQLHVMTTQAYDAYTAYDLFDTGFQQLLLVPPATQPGALSLQVYEAGAGAVTLRQSISLDERLTRCTALEATKSGRRRGIVVSAELSAGGAANQVLCADGGELVLWPRGASGQVVDASSRTYSTLTVRDLWQRGTLYVPCLTQSLSTKTTSQRYYAVEWRDYLSDTGVAQFGMFDAVLGVYVRVPLYWKDSVSLADGLEEGTFRICRKDSGETLAVLRIGTHDAPPGAYQMLRTKGNITVMVLFGEGCTPSERSIIQNGVQFF